MKDYENDLKPLFNELNKIHENMKSIRSDGAKQLNANKFDKIRSKIDGCIKVIKRFTGDKIEVVFENDAYKYIIIVSNDVVTEENKVNPDDKF